jgi:hypothetical protein
MSSYVIATLALVVVALVVIWCRVTRPYRVAKRLDKLDSIPSSKGGHRQKPPRGTAPADPPKGQDTSR